MEPIAIIGMSCRFPGASSLDEYWQLLIEGRDAIEEVPKDRWDADEYFSEDPKELGKTNSRSGGFIKDIDQFDAAFFGISPREAEQMDPQQRILLELAYESFENAGIAPNSIKGSNTAVYIGVMSNDYLRFQTSDNYNRIDVHTGAGAGFCMLANRLSYQFDLHGPSMAVDSACSSSLVTVFQACQALWTNQSDIALAGGVNLMLEPAFNIFYAKGGLMAPDGRCKTFSATADGIGRGEGAGLVVLKRLEDAIRDKDEIYAVIRGGAVNHDGRSNGVTAPNRWSQEKLLRQAFRHANISAKEIDYIELHGTGTYIGDPIEANAIGTILNEQKRVTPCLVGSVKSNIGHLEGAAGIAGVIKLALSISKRSLPPSLWCDEPNPAIDFDTLPIKINKSSRSWESINRSNLIAGINSFGLGGTNAHIVMESPPGTSNQNDNGNSAKQYILLISARSEEALEDKLFQYKKLLCSKVDLEAICMSSIARQDIHEYQICLLGNSIVDLQNAIEDALNKRNNPNSISGKLSMQRKPICIAMPELNRLNLALVSDWLTQAPIASQAWDECGRVSKLVFGESLPSLYNMSTKNLPESTMLQKLWCFVAQYAVLSQLKATIPNELLSIVTDGSAQLAACCASGAIDLKIAMEILNENIKASIPHATYKIRCDCSGTVNPTTFTPKVDSDPVNWLKRVKTFDQAIVVVVNLDASQWEVDALHCLDKHDNSYGYFFARLGTRVPLDGTTLAGRQFFRLPSYPWQRKIFMLPKPEVLDTVPINQDRSSNIAEDDTIRDQVLNLHALERKGFILGYLAQRVAHSLRIPEATLDVKLPLNTLGIDSLTAMEIKSRAERDLNISIPVVKFLDGFSVEDFADFIIDKIEHSNSLDNIENSDFEREKSELSIDGIDNQVAEMSIERVNSLLTQLSSEVA